MSILSLQYSNAKVLRGSGWAEGLEFHGSRNPLAWVGSDGRRPGGCGVRVGRPEAGQEDNRERAARRARTTLRRKAKELYGRFKGKVYMLTLTYRENMTDYEKALNDIRCFLQRLYRYARRKLFYIAVPERQERGAWHWHLLIELHLDYSQWEELWGHGFIWIAKVKSARGAARYIAKYVCKAFEEAGVPKGKHRYLTAQGLGDWDVEYVCVGDELGTWFGFVDREQFRILGVMSIPGQLVWWEAMLDELCFGCPLESFDKEMFKVW